MKWINTKNSLLDSLQIPLFIVIAFILCFFLSMCDEDTGNFTLGEEFIESQTDITLIDTFSVSLSTVILDEVETSGTENMLIGNYYDDILGRIMSKSYFQIGLPTNTDVEYNDIYDSLNLIIKYNDYFFGDTTQSQIISVHQLTENIDIDEEEVLTNRSTFSYNPNPIGTITYTPKPTSEEDTLLIKINDNIGLDLFTILSEESDILDDNDRFIDYFHGLVLVTDDAYGGAVVGFRANSDDVRLVLYATRPGEHENEEIRYEFTMYDSTKQFNHIIYDLSSTQLSPLIEQRSELSSTNTNDLAFLQGGIGLVIRVDFPSLQNILFFEQGTIVKSELTVLSSDIDDSGIDFNSSLLLYKSDRINRAQSKVTSSSKTTTGESYDEETVFSFDITNYLNNELEDLYFDTEASGLLITLSSTNLGSTFKRLILDNESPKTKLKIYYLTY